MSPARSHLAGHGGGAPLASRGPVAEGARTLEFPLELECGLLFAELDGRRCLLDTGAPSSLGEGEGIEVFGVRYGGAGGFLGVDLAAIREHVPCDFDLLVGADLLCAHALVLDLPRGTGALSRVPPRHEALRTEVELLHGVPAVEVRVGDRPLRAVLDTGASHSFLPPERLPEDREAVTVEDFLPGLGRFETRLRPVEIALGGGTLATRAGALPALLRSALALAGLSAILGNAPLRERRVVIDVPRGTLSIGGEPSPAGA